MVIFFATGGLLSALFLLFGSFGIIQGRILMTVFSLGFFSLPILLSASKLDDENFGPFCQVRGFLGGPGFYYAAAAHLGSFGTR